MRLLLRSAFFGSLLVAASFGVLRPAFAQTCSDSLHIPLGYSIVPSNPCDGDSLFFEVSACGPCVDIITVGNYLGVEVLARMDVLQCRNRICLPERQRIALGQFSAGNHFLRINVQGQVVMPDSSVCTTAYQDSITFVVRRCAGSDSLPFVEDIVVGQRVVCVKYPCPDLACPGDSIPVFARGVFPNDCVWLRDIELVPSIATVIGPPTLRIVVGNGVCNGRPCTEVPVPWSGTRRLPPLPPGSYVLPTEVLVITCHDSLPSDSALFRSRQPFLVVPPGYPDCPGPEPGCFRVAWDRFDGLPPCDTSILPGQPGHVVFQVAPSTVPLAGLQGDLVFDTPGLQITEIQQIGHAQNMNLQWTPTAHGARFVLFAVRGAPIPPYTLDDFRGWPVLIVTVAQRLGAVVPDQSALFVVNVLGADSTGAGVDVCPTPGGILPHATVCSGSCCDRNGDGSADVRDLVLMVRCILGLGQCTGNNLDCDGNGLIQVEDVLHCARVILNGNPHDSTGVRPEPTVGVEFGAVRRSQTVDELPITLRGADRVGAARLVLSYPADRYDVSAVDVGGGSEWLSLHEVRDGKLVVALISMAARGEEKLDLTLRLSLKAGQTASGEVRVDESEFSGRDGVGLAVELGHPAQRLTAGPKLALSAGQPNPFSHATTFNVAVQVAGTVEVDAFDLSGRRITRVFKGWMEPGSRALSWDGRGDRGQEIPNGVYFLRAASGGLAVSQRIVLLKSP